MNLKLREYLADTSLITISLIWGSTFIIVKKTVELFEPITFVGLRFTLAFLIMLPFCWSRRKYFNTRLLKDGLIIGVSLFIVFTFQTLALKYSPASEVGFLTGLYVLFVPVLSAVFLKKYPHIFSWIGVIFSAMGMMMITMTDSLSLSLGQTFAILNAFFIGIQIILTDTYSRKHDVILLTAIEIGTVAVFSMIYSVLFENPDYSQLKHSYVFYSLMFNAVIATVFCFFIQMAMQKHTTPTKAAIMFTIEPISSAFFSFFIGSEIMLFKQYAGAAMIVAAIILAEAGTYLRLSKK
ncbi:MAG: DMT family transporter [Deferribacterales bacterium]